MRAFGVNVSILEPGNFIAGTNIFNETFVKSQAELMWSKMDTCSNLWRTLHLPG